MNTYQQVRRLDNEALLKKTKSLADEERRLTLEVLHHLQEIQRRRLFAFRGYGSLFEYVTRELGYSDASAQRRIMAMRLLQEIPEVEEKIKSGNLTLTNAAQAQKLFQTEAKLSQPLNSNQKKKILHQIENKSTREVEKQLMGFSTTPITSQKPDQVRAITPTHSKIQFVADQTLLDQLEQIKGLLAHKFPQLTLAELFSEMARITLWKLQPKAPKPNVSHSNVGSNSNLSPKSRTNLTTSGTSLPNGSSSNIAKHKTAGSLNTSKASHSGAGVDLGIEAGAGVGTGVGVETGAETGAGTGAGTGTGTGTGAGTGAGTGTGTGAGTKISRYIPAEIKRAVNYRDKGRCSYIDPVTQRRCQSHFALEYDHIVPFARGGMSTVENLRLLCRQHNQIHAIASYGKNRMSKFLKVE